jgi:hypothetical protein
VIGRNLDRVGAWGAGEEVIERAVHLRAAESLLHLRVDLERRSRVGMPDLAHHVGQRGTRLDCGVSEFVIERPTFSITR